MTVNGGSLTATGSSGDNSYAIYFSYGGTHSLTVTGGTVTAMGNSSATYIETSIVQTGENTVTVTVSGGGSLTAQSELGMGIVLKSSSERDSNFSTGSMTAETYTITWSNADSTTFPDGGNYAITLDNTGTLTVSVRSSGGGFFSGGSSSGNDSTIIDPQTANGWTQNDSGEWSYYKDGEPVKGWLFDNQKWYWLDKTTGKMFSGGWKQIDGKWYYFYADGSIAVSTKVDGYEVGTDGARIG